MSGRSGVGQFRGATLGPQPLKATIPYQLTTKPRPNRTDGKSAGKARIYQLSSGMRRTMSLDAIIGPYLQGQWPKEPESSSHKDKSTQTPASWTDESQSRKGSSSSSSSNSSSNSNNNSSSSSHKRSASWGSAENLREIAKIKQQLHRSKPPVSGGADKDCQQGYPQGACSLGTTQTQPIPLPLAPLSTLVPPLRCSVEGLNQELEGMFICQPPHPQHRLLEVPDGHRAPIPPQSCSGGSQSDLGTTPQSTPSSPSPPLTYVCSLSPNSEGVHPDMHQGLRAGGELSVSSPFSSQNEAEFSMQLLMSSSPGPNKSYCFQREPPEGCEKVRVWEETSTIQKLKPAVISSCPDPNKINFTPHGGSAFCPVSLLKPLLPSMDLLFRSLAVSPVDACSSQEPSSCTSTAAPLDPAMASAVMGDSSGKGLVF